MSVGGSRCRGRSVLGYQELGLARALGHRAQHLLQGHHLAAQPLAIGLATGIPAWDQWALVNRGAVHDQNSSSSQEIALPWLAVPARYATLQTRNLNMVLNAMQCIAKSTEQQCPHKHRPRKTIVHQLLHSWRDF
eukprot:1138089-Pelagomonas_calceolata.AAC.10